MRATQPRTQKATFEMGHAVMDSLLTLLEVYKNQVFMRKVCSHYCILIFIRPFLVIYHPQILSGLRRE